MRLVDGFFPVLAYAAYLRRNFDQVDLSPEAAGVDLTHLFAKAEESVRVHFPPEDIDQARFAVAAFVDEAIMLSDWPGAAQWAGQMFQRRFFSTTNAGEEFFTRLAELPAENRVVREVYATCLSLGFLGRYFDERHKPELEAIKQQNVAFLWGQEAIEAEFPDECLFPSAYAQGKFKGLARRLWGRLDPLTTFLVLLPPMILITLFAFYRYLLNQEIFNYLQSKL